jgi:hypothetical protein
MLQMSTTSGVWQADGARAGRRWVRPRSTLARIAIASIRSKTPSPEGGDMFNRPRLAIACNETTAKIFNGSLKLALGGIQGKSGGLARDEG